MSEAEWVATVITPTPEDSADVRWACETASAMWLRGQREQTLRWVHHAVQAATAEGKHLRADELDRAAQELEHLPLLRRPSVPPANTPASTTQPTADDAPPAPAKGKLARTAPYKLAPDDITYLEAPALGLLEACEPSGNNPTHAGVGPETAAMSQEVRTTKSGAGPEFVPEDSPRLQPLAAPKASRPLPPAPTQDPYEATVVNAGIKPKQDRTMVMDMRGFSPGAPEPEPEPEPQPAVPPSVPAAPAIASPRPYSFEPTPASLLGAPRASSRPHTDFEQTVERRVPIIPDELPTDKTATENAVADSVSAASSSSALSSVPGTLGSPNLPLESMRARRVAVSQGSGKELGIRLLDDEEAAPAGTQEALLLPLKTP